MRDSFYIIIGCGGHSKIVTDIIRSNSYGKILGYIDDIEQDDKLYLGRVDYINAIINKHQDNNLCQLKYNIVIAIGDNRIRHNIYQKICKLNESMNIYFPSIIHPSAIISPTAQICQGSVISAGTIVGPNAKINSFTIINTGTTVDHDCVIEDFANLSPGVTLGGNVKIGKFTFIGLGSNIIHKIQIGDDVVIGAGSLVVKSFQESCKVLYGSPAKVIRDREKMDKYL